MIAFVHSNLIGGFMNVMVAATPLAIVILLYAKCPKSTELNDKFFFFYEFRATAIIWFCGFVLLIVATLVIEIGRVYNTTTKILAFVAGSAPFVVPSFLSTLWIPRKILQVKIWNRLRATMDMVELIPIASVKSVSASDSPHTKITDRMNAMFKNGDKFSQFVQFMYKEFSSESILCFIEFAQFKTEVMDFLSEHHALLYANLANRNDYVDLFGDDMVQSSIVYSDNGDGNNSIKRLRNIAHLLYAKYIKLNSKFEVNISSSFRKELEKIDNNNWKLLEMNETNIKEFVRLLDDLLLVMFKFMKSSFVRYEEPTIRV